MNQTSTTPTREQVIQLLMADEVYQALNLDPYYDKGTGCYPNIYELLETLGVGGMEIDSVMQGE
ncbi:hypothetical protein VPBG_00187 [Vibrio phage helene 12B3]|uniref:hypothetical protein n=1 Tax=Vibrio phage helene 12B3 TaxID=573173 RepID=UPI0002C11A56|nr:hypothetical protein VPBG_00187 [Vibrio phage helene 12B3]YP_009223056.1 hypothetical protein VPLG_00207 [Vibrio phage eugene 12A10]AGG57959.1 hypothetical protein VPBG_00187 [Vibrio phage helene 12B3]AGN51646.1 hypothetical protein VPLG_00207 [Vibrio phage eugene 12A10]